MKLGSQAFKISLNLVSGIISTPPFYLTVYMNVNLKFLTNVEVRLI